MEIVTLFKILSVVLLIGGTIYSIQNNNLKGLFFTLFIISGIIIFLNTHYVEDKNTSNKEIKQNKQSININNKLYDEKSKKD